MPDKYRTRASKIAERAIKLSVWGKEYAANFASHEHDDDNLTYWEDQLNQIEKADK